MSGISVAIINHNTRELLRACLESVKGTPAIETIVIDNCSSDGSATMVHDEFPGVRLQANLTNTGYGSAANQAVSMAVTPYLLVLNSDTFVHAGALEACKEYLDQHPRAGLVGPRLINRDGTLQASCYPALTPTYLLLSESTLGKIVGRVPGLRESYLRTWSHHHNRRVPWVLGAALAVRCDAFNSIGGFDEQFFMYSEEVDLCYRLETAGWEIHFTPTATITHLGAASTIQYRTAMAVQLYASLDRLYRRHYPQRMIQLKVVVAYIMIRNIMRDIFTLLRARGSEEQHIRIREDLSVWKTVLLTQFGVSGSRV